MKNKTETKKTIYYISRGFVILELFKCRNKSLNDSTVQQYIAFFRAYQVIILKALICNICNILWDHNLLQLLLDFFTWPQVWPPCFTYIAACTASAIMAILHWVQAWQITKAWLATFFELPHTQPPVTCLFDGPNSQAQAQLYQIYIAPHIKACNFSFNFFSIAQLISKCPYEKPVWTKYQRKYF